MERKPSQAIELFYCYARKDRALRDELDIHLAGLRRSGLITAWYDGEISPGSLWEKEIEAHLHIARVILLLVSPDFLHSDYCYSKEMIYALERHHKQEARVIPVLLRPTDLVGTPFGTLQMLPSNALPITRWSDRDEALEDVVQNIRRVINDLILSLETVPIKKGPQNAVADTQELIDTTPLVEEQGETNLVAPLAIQQSSIQKPPMISPSSGDVSGTALTTSLPSIQETQPAQQTSSPVVTIPHIAPLHSRSFLTKRMVLLITLVLLLIGGSFFGYLGIYQTNLQATTRAAPTETAQAAIDAYNVEVTLDGVMFGFDAAHTHWNRYEHIINTKNVSRLVQMWSYQINGSDKSLPVIGNGMVYVGSDDNRLYAFDATCRSTCTPLWSYSTGGSILSSPAIGNGMVYIGSLDHSLYTFDAACRSACPPLWSYATGGSILSSPTIANGIVYIGSRDNKIYAFDAACRRACTPLWSYTTSGGVGSSPTVVNEIVYVGSDDHRFYAFDATCRNACVPLWSYLTNGNIFSSAAVANGIVYVGSQDSKSGAQDGTFYAFDANCRSACKPLWSYQTGSIFSSPAIGNGMVYIDSFTGKFYAFDASCRSACNPLWSYPTDRSIRYSPMVANGVVYMGADDHILYAFDASCRRTCTPLWSYLTHGEVGSPVVANGIVYIGSSDGKFYAFGLPK